MWQSDSKILKKTSRYAATKEDFFDSCLWESLERNTDIHKSTRMNFDVPSHFSKESARTSRFFREEVIAVSGVGWF